MYTNHKKNIMGMTLLEVFLALTVLIIISLSFLEYMQKQKQHSTVILAKTQINGLLNAATQYHTVYLQWPTSLNALIPFLSNTATKNFSFCSPWLTNSGCAAYSIANQTNYFALQVTTPSSRSAQDLVSMLPNAYIKNTTTVIAYTTTFVGFSQASNSPPVPTGIMYATTASYWHAPGTSSYGLVDATSTYGTFQSENYSSQKDGEKNFYYSPQSQTCPSDSQATMVLFPAGNSPVSQPGDGFYYNYNHYWISTSTGTAGPCSRAYLDNSLSVTNGNYLMAMDVICLSGSAIANWPDISMMFSGSSC